MIDHQKEELIAFETCEIPGNPCLATRYRWTLKGCRGGIKLESIIVGNKRFTSIEAVGRFIAALNTPKSTIPEMSSGQRQKQNLAAKRKLEAGRV